MSERTKDNRVIIRGVQLPDAGAIRTFTGDKDTDLDDLEAVMTKEQYQRLKEDGSLEGDWHPKGKPAEPMKGSKLDRLKEPERATAKDQQDLVKEIQSLKAQVAQLQAAKEEPVAEPTPADAGEKHAKKGGK